VLDEDVVLENTDLDAAVLAANDHLAVNAFATSEEFRFRDDRTATPNVTRISAALALGFDPRRPADTLRLGDLLRFDVDALDTL
jgi:hypothetical protein